MKLYNRIGLLALAMSGMMSCAVNDQFDDNLELGQELPTVSWELASTVCKAGESVSFKAKYYASKGHTVDHAEVWASVSRAESAAATVKLTPKLIYTKTVSSSDTVRSSQMIASFPATDGVWNNYEYELSKSFPVSQTLTPVTWKSPKEWDQKKFDTYYPATFQAEFNNAVIDYLTKDSAYYADLKAVYAKHNFTKEQFENLNAKYGINFPTETDATKKAALWYDKVVETVGGVERPVIKVVGKYYLTMEKDVEGKDIKIVHEVPVDYVHPDPAVRLYDVYDSSFWVFYRYSDDLGVPVASVRAQYMPYLKDLISLISFADWTYNTTDKVYTVEFKRTYSLTPTIKVYNEIGKVGTDTEEKTVTLN